MQDYDFLQYQTQFETKSVNVLTNGLAKHAAELKVKLIFEIVGEQAIVKGNNSIMVAINITWNETGNRHFHFITPEMTHGVGRAPVALFNGLIPQNTDLTSFAFVNSAVVKAKPDGTDATLAWELNPQTGVLTLYNKFALSQTAIRLQVDQLNHSSWRSFQKI